FKKAFQALLNFTDHESLDMGGLRIRLSEPIDMQAAVGNRDTSAVRRVVRNGQIQCDSSAAWDTDVQTSQATYDPNSRLQLRDVANISNIQVGSLVEGVGVGREIYVQEVNVAQSRLTLTQPLYDAAGTQIFTFKRFKYALDFIGFADLSQFTLENIELQCNGNASGIMMAQDGVAFQLRDSYLTKPKDRGITSAGFGCQGMMIDRCNWTSNEIDIPVQDRTTIGFNMNANDVKIRDNRIVRFKHFCILGGSGAVITGNHWFHGDTTTDGIRKAGIIFT
ncbi:MAG: right-handed parallel beta-helix repeat-containing protein, partial [Pseudomonadota bacterium]